MKRLLNAIYWDIIRQYRNGFYLVSALVVASFALLLRQLEGVDWGLWWPVILLENLVMNTFYFLSGIVLLEKSEGTLEAQVVTPLRDREYLLAKVASLFVLSALESLALILLVSGLGFNWFWMLLGIAFFVAIYTLYGFFVVSRYDSISEFILPSAVWTIGFSLPLLPYFDLWQHWSLYLHPLQAPLVLVRAAYAPTPGWLLAYGVLYGALWVWIGWIVSQRAFYRFVVAKEGTRR
ncbi:MAG: ABC transporter permease [Chloroflexota bacterium]